MNRDWYYTLWQISFAIPLSLGTALISTGYNYSLAQLLPDDSLGAENSLVTPEALRDLIEGGAIRGDNLFHSFTEFNVDDGGSVIFANPEGILNILTRVTGGNPSNILGTLGVDGAANLFLLNPNGIFFGENAQLSITGSFLATTADSFVFEDFEFSASNPQAPPLLTVNIPIGLRFRDNPGDITVDRSVLEVSQGQNLSLIGGNVSLQNSNLRASGGRIELGGLTTAGTVEINPDFSLVFPETIAQGDVTLTESTVQTSLFNEEQGNAGTINVNSDLLRLESSFIQANLEGQSQGNAGIININANAVEVIGTLVNDDEGNPIGIGSGIQARITGNNQGTENSDGGQINILADSVLVQDSQIEVNTGNNSLGNAGNILIDTPETGSIELRSTGNNFPRTQINIGVGSNSTGNAGIVEIKTGSLTLDGRSGQLIAILSSIGRNSVAPDNADQIIVEATDSVNILGNARMETTIRGGGQGDGGTINITTGTLLLDGDGFEARIKASLNGTDDFGRDVPQEERNPTRGTAGDLIVNANSIELRNGANFQLNSQLDSEGTAGNVEIFTETLTLTNGSFINTSTQGNGDAGTIKIEASESVIVSGVIDNQNIFFIDNEGEVVGLVPPSRIESISFDNDDGQAGQITIKTPNLRVENGGLITTNTNSTSDGGNIVINGEVLELVDGGQITARARNQGDAGSIDLNTSERITISGSDPDREKILQKLINNLQERVDNEEFPADTNVELVAEEAFFTIGDRSGVFGSTDADSTGNGGIIDINSASLIMSERGTISAVSEGSGFGGDILVEANNLDLINQATIEASTQGEGNAGNIKLTVADSIFIDGEGTGIFGNAETSSTGIGGSINIDPELVVISNGGVISVNSEGTGRGGEILLIADNLTLDDGTITAQTTNSDGGNINLAIADLLLLRNGSLISAEAGGDGDGGNVEISTQFLVAFPQENSDISANANRGDGGNVDIDARRVYGIKFRLNSSNFSDITASSDFGLSGTVLINQPDVEPERGVIELPEAVVDSSEQIAENACQQSVGSQFASTGRGGLPPNPNDTINSDTVRVDLVQPVPSSTSNANIDLNSLPLDDEGKPIIPARGWIFTDDGKVILTAYDPNQIHSQRSQQPKTCGNN